MSKTKKHEPVIWRSRGQIPAHYQHITTFERTFSDGALHALRWACRSGNIAFAGRLIRPGKQKGRVYCDPAQAAVFMRDWEADQKRRAEEKAKGSANGTGDANRNGVVQTTLQIEEGLTGTQVRALIFACLTEFAKQLEPVVREQVKESIEQALEPVVRKQVKEFIEQSLDEAVRTSLDTRIMELFGPEAV